MCPFRPRLAFPFRVYIRIAQRHPSLSVLSKAIVKPGVAKTMTPALQSIHAR